MEASACGLPVVATDIPGCREVVHSGENGILVAPRSAEALAAGLASLLDDPVRVAAMAESASRMAAASFDVRAVVARVRREYRLPAAQG
jgi:glycosyltransferase involved in cell wall biosynthesis